MSFTYGFFNARNGDRIYDATQFSEIFDGIIHDGIYSNIGDRFKVEPGAGMQILVGTGRAWFLGRWMKNDSKYSIPIQRSEVLLDRIDAVILDVRAADNYRDVQLTVVTGVPSQAPVRPELISNPDRRQVPLAYIRVNRQSSAIPAGNITYMVGQKPAPFVVGAAASIPIDDIVESWEYQWIDWLNKNQKNYTYSATQKLVAFQTDLDNMYKEAYYKSDAYQTEEHEKWEAWLNDMKGMLDDEGSIEQAKQIAELSEFRRELLYNQSISENLAVSSGDILETSNGLKIDAQVIFQRRII